MKENNVYFFHIPKTAGVSVWRYLEGAFPAEQICPWWLWDQLVTVPSSQLEQWRVFRGHFLSHLAPYLSRTLTTFTMLRDPLHRTISHYCHVRRAPEHPYHQYALRMSLLEFCTDSETRGMVENYQCAYLTKAPVDVRSAAAGLTSSCLERLELQEKLQKPDRLKHPEALFDRAMEQLLKFCVVGTTETFNSSLTRLGGCLGCSSQPVFERLNVNPERVDPSTLDALTLEAIEEATQVDRRLYRTVMTQLAEPIGIPA